MIGPRLRILLYAVFAITAVTAANSVYLASITALEWLSRRGGTAVSYQDHFYLSMFALHVALGLLLIVPFLVFGIAHLLAARGRRNRRAVRIGYALFGICLLLLASGVLLVRLEGLIDLKHPTARAVAYWLHVGCPLAAIWLYWLHRLAGPRIKWRVAGVYAALTAVIVVGMVLWQTHDPRSWSARGPAEGPDYFQPSRVKTADGKLIPARSLMMDEYCRRCHPDAYEGWFHSVHHLASFNNPPYRATVRETRRVALERDGDVKAVRFCAGCHDVVPFLSGAFDQKEFDDVHDPTAQAGITCSVCHAITHVNSTVGNGDYTLEQPLHYPFAYSQNRLLQYINHQLVRAKPSFHKQTFLKPLHKTAEFCSACHKVHLPGSLTTYKEFLRGQNHYDSYLLSGVSGHGARSFYYPPQAETNCNGCHMPLQVSRDFGAKPFDGSGQLQIHNHLFPSANTGIASLRGEERIIAAHQEFLKGVIRVDLFGINSGGSLNDPYTAPLRPAALEATDVDGVRTNTRFLWEILGAEAVRSGDVSTRLLESAPPQCGNSAADHAKAWLIAAAAGSTIGPAMAGGTRDRLRRPCGKSAPGAAGGGGGGGRGRGRSGLRAGRERAGGGAVPLRFARVDTPIGSLVLYVTGKAVCGLGFEERCAGVREALVRRFGGQIVEEDPDPAGVASRLRGYFSGDLRALDPVEIDTGGTPFQQRVWITLRLVPAGATISYARLAEAVGKPDAVRAVGAANARNPVAIVVPCHRVIGADGSMTGYGGGIDRKVWLLRHEGALPSGGGS